MYVCVCVCVCVGVGVSACECVCIMQYCIYALRYVLSAIIQPVLLVSMYVLCNI